MKTACAHAYEPTRPRRQHLLRAGEGSERRGARFRTVRAGLSKSRGWTGKPLSAAALTRKGFPAHWQTTIGIAARPKDKPADEGNARAWPRLAQNQIYVVPQNQAKTMNASTEPKTATNVINGRINGRFAPGVSGNPGGSPEATRRAFKKRFLLDLAEDWQQHGREVFKRVRRESPAAYLKVCLQKSLNRSGASMRCRRLYAKTLPKCRLQSAMNSMLAHR